MRVIASLRARRVPAGRGRFTPIVATILLTGVLLGVLLSGQALTAPQPLAEKLLSLYEKRLAESYPGADVALLEGELKRAQAALGPRLRIREAAFVGFSTAAEIGVDLTGSLSFPLSDPEAVAHASLMRRRLELAEHDHAYERSRLLFDFRRTLRLAAHFEKVVAVLVENRREMLSLRPEWRALERSGELSYLSGRELEYLEFVDALARARGELELLVGSLSASTGVREAVLEKAGIGPLPAGGPFEPDNGPTCANGGVAMRRVRLVHRENLADEGVEAARRLPSVRLDLDADIGFDAGASAPLRAEVQVGLQVALPAAAALAGAAPLVTLAADPARLSQEVALSWPGPAFTSEMERIGEADRAFRRSALSVGLATRRLVASQAAAEAALRLRKLALRSLENGSFDPELLVALARARLTVLDAELELDLATLELWQACEGAQVRTSTTSRFTPSIRSTNPVSSSWTSSIRPSSLRTNRV